MNYKNIFKRETKVIAYVVICLTLVVIGTSYALFLQVNNNTNNQVVTAGSLTVTYSGGNTVTVDDSDSNCLTPQSDTDGSGSGGCKFTLSITNTGTLPMQYDLLIYNNTADAPNGVTFLDHSLVRHSLKKQYTVANTNETVTAAAALSTLANYNSTEKRILETSVIEAGETITFALNVWIDESASADVVGHYVYLKLDVIGTVYEEAAATQTLLSSMDNNGLTEIMNETVAASETNTNAKEYRYSGANPKNYVYYNCTNDAQVNTCEVWRILGIYNVEKDGNTENRIKLIKNENLETAAWDSNGGTTYNASTLNTYLNNTYYNSLSETAKNQIANATYKLGGADALDINSKEMYYNELSSSDSVTAKVGIMNVSDYSFASGSQDSIQNIASTNESNWLYKGTKEWLINKNNSGEIYTISADGKIETGTPTEELLIRPVVYLTNNVKITDGDGTASNPYVLSK